MNNLLQIIKAGNYGYAITITLWKLIINIIVLNEL